MTTKIKTTVATTTVRNVKKNTKTLAAKPAKKNAPVAKPDAKESKTDAKKMSQIEAAVAVLSKSKVTMSCRSMVEAMQVQGLWSTPGGATPEATLYASILREINGKGKDARFKKVDRGLFDLATKR